MSNGPNRQLELAQALSGIAVEVGAFALGSHGAPKEAVYNTACQKLFLPGEVPRRSDKITMAKALKLGIDGHEVRSFNKYWKKFLLANPRYDSDSLEYSPGGRRGNKTIQSTTVQAMAGKTQRTNARLARKINAQVLATEDLAAEIMLQGQPGYTAREARKLTTGCRLHMFDKKQGGRTVARPTPFNGEKEVREKRDAY